MWGRVLKSGQVRRDKEEQDPCRDFRLLGHLASAELQVTAGARPFPAHQTQHLHTCTQDRREGFGSARVAVVSGKRRTDRLADTGAPHSRLRGCADRVGNRGTTDSHRQLQVSGVALCYEIQDPVALSLG